MDSSVTESGATDVTESGAAKSDTAAPDAHPRVLLVMSQEAQYWRRLRGAQEAWAARLPAAKAAAVREFARRASPACLSPPRRKEKLLENGKESGTERTTWGPN